MINKLDKHNLNCNIFSVYDYDGLTMQELLCQFFTKINECIEVSNNSLSFLEWLKSIGLKEEVAIYLDKMVTDGTLNNIINHSIFNELSSKIESVFNNHLLINVKDYGAIGDGITDDTQAIKNALENGNVIRFPRGVYRVTDTITINKTVILIGDEWCGDSLYKDATSTLYFDNGSIDKYMFVFNKPNNKIKNLMFRGLGSGSDRRNWNKCLQFNKGTIFGDTDSVIEGCCFYKFANVIEFEGRGLICFNNSFVETWKTIILKHYNNNESANPPTYDFQTNTRGFRKFHFINNIIHACQGWFINCNSTSESNYEKYIHQVLVTGNRFDGTGGLWNGYIGGGVVTGNTIGKSGSIVYSSVRTPIFSLTGCKQMTFSGNTIYSELDYSSILGRKTELSDVWFFDGSNGDFQDIVITANNLRHVGRRIIKASNSSVYRLIFSNNNVYGVLLIESSPSVSAIEFDGGANNIKIKDNIINNTNGVKHNLLVNFTARGVVNHNISDNIFSTSEFEVSNNAYAWNKRNNVEGTNYQGNGDTQTLTFTQNIDYVILTDVTSKKSFVKRSGTNVGNDIVEILDNTCTIKNTSDFNTQGRSYSIFAVCC